MIVLIFSNGFNRILYLQFFQFPFGFQIKENIYLSTCKCKYLLFWKKVFYLIYLYYAKDVNVLVESTQTNRSYELIITWRCGFSFAYYCRFDFSRVACRPLKFIGVTGIRKLLFSLVFLYIMIFMPESPGFISLDKLLYSWKEENIQELGWRRRCLNFESLRLKVCISISINNNLIETLRKHVVFLIYFMASDTY